MKLMIIFAVSGLTLGLLGGSAVGGLKGKAAILADLEAEKAAEVAAARRRAAEEGVGASTDQDREEQNREGLHPPEDGAPEGEAVVSGGKSEASAPELSAGPVAEAQGASGEGPDSSPAEAHGQTPGLSSGAADDPPTTPGANEASQRLAKIFGAMKAQDAAAVLEKLEDAEIRAILFHLTDRKAAEILGNFQPDRAAKLSRNLLGSPGGGAS